MINNPNVIIDALSASLTTEGFKKKSNSWYFNNNDVVLLINLQKSQYGYQYYLNCAIALKILGAVKFPKEHLCHIRFRLTSIVPDDKKKTVESIFDLENELFSDEVRKEQIAKLICEYVLPILKKCSSIVGITDVVKSGQLAKAMVHKKVKELIR